MAAPSFHTVTLGCKLNQFDTAAVEGELARRGYVPAPDAGDASVVVINTCTVTGKADADARRIVRSVRRANRHCRLLVTGCYAERDAQALEALGGIDRVFGNRDKPRLEAILDELGIHGEPPTADTLPLLSRKSGKNCQQHQGQQPRPACSVHTVFGGTKQTSLLFFTTALEPCSTFG